MGMPTFIFITQLMLLDAVPVVYSTLPLLPAQRVWH